MPIGGCGDNRGCCGNGRCLVEGDQKDCCSDFCCCGSSVSGITMLWSNDEEPVPVVRTEFVPGYGPQCSQLMNTIEHTWTESQWAVWERLRKDMGC